MKPDSAAQDKQKNKSGRKWLKRFIRAIVGFILIMVLVILAVLLLYAVNLHHKPNLDELLIRANLAKFPESVRNLQVDTLPNIVRGRAVPNQSEMLVRFEAEPNDIDKFINNSLSIDKNSFRPLFPLPDDGHVPSWWPTDDSSGRRYWFRVRDDIQGMVAVYDSSNTVRIWALYIVNPQLRDMQNTFESMYDGSMDFLQDMLHEVMDLFD